MGIVENNSEKEYGHAQPEALYPLFKSDIEYDLIKKVVLKRFRGVRKEILVMYKYLASQHMPSFIIFSEVLPYGIVIKKLDADRAWREVFCDKILRSFHFFKFFVKYHNTLDCISEKYMYGYDIHELPKRILGDEIIIQKIFFWLGKCAAVAWVFGIGDRGHNERLNISETNDIADLYTYTFNSEPIINIDFETFPSRRLTNIYVDVDEIGLPFYAVFRQLPKRFRTFIDYYYDLFKRGFFSKLHFIRDTWRTKHKKFTRALNRYFVVNPQPDQEEVMAEINNRASGRIDRSLFDESFFLINDSLEKAGKMEGFLKKKSIKEIRKRLRADREI